MQEVNKPDVDVFHQPSFKWVGAVDTPASGLDIKNYLVSDQVSHDLINTDNGDTIIVQGL